MKLNSLKCLADAFPGAEGAIGCPRVDNFGKDLPSSPVPGPPPLAASPARAFRRPLLAALVGLILASLLPDASVGSESGTSGFEYLGGWYVLVHSREADEGASDGPRWDDQVWQFRQRGDRLYWAIFPHPEFRDPAGRRESVPGGEEARSTGAWEPNGEQLKEISRGLEYSPQDEVTKTLKRDGAGRWVSSPRRPSFSASQVGYHERWRIEEGADGPIFTREAFMGSGRTESAESLTLFRAGSVAQAGDEITGEYQRDGEFGGQFRMVRMGESPERGAGR